MRPSRALRFARRAWRRLAALGSSSAPPSVVPEALPGSFCVVPWLRRFSDEQGCVKVCCCAHGDDAVVGGVSGHPIHISDRPSDDEIFNSGRLRRLRKSMLAGEWDPVCRGCREIAEAGGEGPREASNRRHAAAIPDLLARTAPDGALDASAARSVDLRLGTVCNLTCRMCGPQSSHRWEGLDLRVQPGGAPVRAAPVSPGPGWLQDDDVWEWFRSSLSRVEELHFAGGEPLLIPETVRALRTLHRDRPCGPDRPQLQHQPYPSAKARHRPVAELSRGHADLQHRRCRPGDRVHPPGIAVGGRRTQPSRGRRELRPLEHQVRRSVGNRAGIQHPPPRRPFRAPCHRV